MSRPALEGELRGEGKGMGAGVYHKTVLICVI